MSARADITSWQGNSMIIVNWDCASFFTWKWAAWQKCYFLYGFLQFL